MREDDGERVWARGAARSSRANDFVRSARESKVHGQFECANARERVDNGSGKVRVRLYFPFRGTCVHGNRSSSNGKGGNVRNANAEVTSCRVR